MEFTMSSWEQRVARQSAYELYNSAALFVYFLLLHDGDASAIPGFLDALRRERNRPRAVIANSGFRMVSGQPMSEFVKKATSDFIRRGRSDEKLTADFSAFVKKLGLRVVFEAPPPR
jgi:3-methyladenine DNA glycosylase AlkC